MSLQTSAISPGFGARLKEERHRLKLSQAEFAELAEVRRLAQSQYESESTSPTVKYLAAISTAGVDLQYVLFGRKNPIASLSIPDQRRVEKKAFDLIEEFARKQPDGQLSSDGRHVLFELLRSYLTRAALGEQLPDLDPATLVPFQGSGTL